MSHDIQTLLVNPPSSDREPTGASSTPIYQSATFAVSDNGRWDYSRSGNPTREVLETQLALLDGADHGFAFASGVSALATVFRLVPQGGRIVCACDVYGGTFRLLHLLAADHNWQLAFLDLSDSQSVAEIAELGADLVFVEVPSNPLLLGSDVAFIREVARETLLVVDHSMLSPVKYRPLDLGADIAVQSGTKLLGGHGDLTAGVVSTNDAGIASKVKFRQNAEGTALAPFESWLLLRGLQTLPLRLERQLRNTQRIRDVLEAHDAVERVYYPRDTGQQGPVISFTTGSVDASESIARASTLFRTTVSFGSVFSSVSLPCRMSHASVPESLRTVCRLPTDLVRLSIGIESADDLCTDLHAALNHAVLETAVP